MSIVFPRDMPLVGAARQVFELRRKDFLSPETGARVGSMPAGLPLWYAKWTLGQGGPRRADEWKAFVDSLDGASRLFLGRDLSRPFPLAYQDLNMTTLARAGGGAFDGAATSWSTGATSDGQAYLVLNGLPAGFQLSFSDYVGFRWTTGGQRRAAKVRVIQPYTATSGGVAIPDIRPAVHSIVPPGAVAHFDNPACLMRLVTDETTIGEMDRRLASAATVTAIQELLA